MAIKRILVSFCGIGENPWIVLKRLSVIFVELLFFLSEL